jgi:hypothetical protein
MLGGNHVDFFKTVGKQVPGFGFPAASFGFIHRSQELSLIGPEEFDEFLVFRAEFAGLEKQNDKIRFFKNFEGAFNHNPFEFPFGGIPIPVKLEAACIYKPQRLSQEYSIHYYRVPGYPRRRIGNGAPFAQQPVKEGRLPHIWTTSQSDHW